MSAFLEQELAGGNRQQIGDPRISQAVHAVAARDRLLTDEEINERARILSNEHVASQAQEIIAENPPDGAERLTSLAAQYDAAPDAQRTLEAAEAALAVSEEPGRRSALAERAHRLRVEGNYNRTRAAAMLRDRVEELEELRKQDSKVFNGSAGSVPAAVGNTLSYTANTAIEFLDAHFLPGFYAEVINMVKDAAPEVAGVVDYLQPEEARREITRMIVDLPPEKSKQIVDSIFKAAHNRQGRLLQDNYLAEAHLLAEFLEPLEYGESKYNLSNFFAPLDYVLGGALVRAGVKSAVKGVQTSKALAHFLFKFPKRSVPWTISDYEKGAESLVKAATTPNGAPLAEALGTNQTAIVGELVLPKPAFIKVGEEVVGYRAVGEGKFEPIIKERVRATGEAPTTKPDTTLVGQEITPKSRVRMNEKGEMIPAEVKPTFFPHGKPFLDEFFLSAEAKAAKAKSIEQGLKDTFSLRLNDTLVEESEAGMTAYMRIGNERGVGWSLPQEAASWAKTNLNVPFTIEKDLIGTYQVVVKHFYAYGLDDVGKFINPIGGTGVGKGSRFSEFIARASSEAGFITQRATKINKEIAAAFTRLSRQDSLRVQETLLEGERAGKEFSRSELTNMGLNASEIEGYEAIRQLTGKVLRLKNEETHAALRSAGFNQIVDVDGGQAIAKLVDPNQIGAQRLLSNSLRSVDLVTGAPVKLANLDLSKFKLYRFFEDTKSGYTYGVAPLHNSVPFYRLPVGVLKAVQGWMPRYYNAPYFVREVAADGHTTALKTARSRKAAEEEVARLSASDPSKQFRVYEASEIADDAGTVADIAMLREQGLLFSSHRNPLPLMDVEGGVAALSVPNSIERLVQSASLQEGIGRWTLAMAHTFDNTYGKALGFSMDLARAPQRPLDATKHALFDEAMQIYDFVRRVNGLDATQGAGQWVRGQRNKIADLFYNFGYQKSGKVKGVSEWFGDNISGLNPTVFRNLKSAAFMAYIGLNPVVHAPLQMSMIPTYAGVKHALSYMAKGRFFNDLMVLQFSNDVAKLDTLRKRLGLSNQYVETLLRDYRQSGLQQMVDNHISVAGTLGDARVATASKARKGMAAVFNAAKGVGFDVGVSADKRAAWLVMRNRALQNGETLNATGLKKVAQDAEHLTGSLNQTDPLYNADGVISLFAQFLSHPIKMVNRLVGGVTNGRVGKEVSLSPSEQRRVALASLASYGFAGFGVTELIERLNTQHNWNLPDNVKLTLQEGLVGALINTAIRVTDAEGETSKVMFSSKFSPFAQAGMLLTNGRELGKLFLQADWEQMVEFLPNPAALGVVGSTLDVASFFYTLAGGTDLPPEEKALATATEFFKKFPMTNNAMKAHMAYNLGYKFDSRGKAVVEATKGEAIASLWGLKSYSEYAIMRGNVELYGEFEPLSGEALSDRIKGAVQDTLGWLIPTLRSMGDGKISKQEAADLIESHNIAFVTALEPNEYAEYRDALAREILRSDVIKSDRFLEALSKRITSGQVPATASLRDQLYGLEFPGKERIIPAIERLFKEVEVE